MDTLGLDEAGRGPVLGPLVVAGIVIPEKKEKIIERMGVKDSKRLTPGCEGFQKINSKQKNCLISKANQDV